MKDGKPESLVTPCNAPGAKGAGRGGWRRAVRWAVWSGATLIAGAVVAAGIALARVDGMTQGAVERWGTQALGVAVRVEGAEVSVLKGTVTLTGLRVANPAGLGFREGDFVTVGRVSGRGDLLRAVRTGEVRLRELVIESPQFTHEEVKGLSNVEAVRRGMARGVAGPGGGAAAAPEAARLRIDRLRIKDVSVRALRDGTVVGVFTAAAIEIPELCGQNGQGVAPERVADAVLARVFGNGAPAGPKETRKASPKRSEPRHGK
jgi:hypothetical protein